MKKVILILVLLAAPLGLFATGQSRAAQKTGLTTSLPDQTTGAITPAVLRTSLGVLIDSAYNPIDDGTPFTGSIAFASIDGGTNAGVMQSDGAHHVSVNNTINALLTPLSGSFSGITAATPTQAELVVENGTFGNGATKYELLRIGDGTSAGGLPSGFISAGDVYSGSISPGGTTLPWFIGTTSIVDGISGSHTYVAPNAPPGRGSLDLQVLRTNSGHTATGAGSSILGGMDNTASGNYCTVAGHGALASANYAVAMGFDGTIASGVGSTAFNALASGSSSFSVGGAWAIGSYASAQSGGFAVGDDSFSTGGVKGILATAPIGLIGASISSGVASSAMGPNIAEGNGDHAIGQGAASGYDQAAAYAVGSYSSVTHSVLTLSPQNQSESTVGNDFQAGDTILLVSQNGLSKITTSVLSVSGLTITVNTNLPATTYVFAAIFNQTATTGHFVFASAQGNDGTYGQVQERQATLQGLSTSATAVRLTVDGNSATNQNVLRFGAHRTYACTFRIVARKPSTNDSACWTYQALFKRSSSGTVSLVGSVVQVGTTINDSGASAWSVAITADTTFSAVNVSCTGAASSTINWGCLASIVEVYGF